MNYKHSCVVDAKFIYKTLVLVLLTQADQGEEQEWKVQNYTLAEGEQLIDTAPPIMRPHAGAAGFVYPKWNAADSAWFESATEEEISVWESKHPNPNIGSLSDEKAKRVSKSKSDLKTYLATHPLAWIDGKQYNITDEKTGWLTSKVVAATAAAGVGIPYDLKWNDTGMVCKNWSLSDLTSLALAIDKRVTSLVTYQQEKEIEIKSAKTMDELNRIEIDYDSV